VLLAGRGRDGGNCLPSVTNLIGCGTDQEPVNCGFGIKAAGVDPYSNPGRPGPGIGGVAAGVASGVASGVATGVTGADMEGIGDGSQALTPCAGNGFAAFRGDGIKTGLPSMEVIWIRLGAKGNFAGEAACTGTKA